MSEPWHYWRNGREAGGREGPPPRRRGTGTVGAGFMSRHSRRRRRRLIRLVLPLIVLAAVGGVIYAVISAQAVVPGISERLYPIHYREGIERMAERYDLDPYLLAAVVRTESDYDPQAVSHAGAVGLMQLMPDTADWVVRLAGWQGPSDPELTDPEHSLELGACYLAYLVERFGGNMRAALAAYNAGQGAVDGWLAEAGHGSDLRLEDIPFKETRDFVKRVERMREVYVRIHDDIFSEAMATASGPIVAAVPVAAAPVAGPPPAEPPAGL